MRHSIEHSIYVSGMKSFVMIFSANKERRDKRKMETVSLFSSDLEKLVRYIFTLYSIEHF